MTVLTIVAAGCGGGEEPRPPVRTASPVATAAPTPDPAKGERERRKPVRLTVGVGGDLLPHLPIVAAARTARGYDFRPMLRPIRRWVRRNDLAFCHVETPLTDAAPSGYPVFNSPPALARAIKATGFDACSTASNHALDRGQPGIDATRRALARAHVRHTGTFSSPRRRPVMLRRRHVKVALLSYTQSTNGLPLPHPWSVNLAEPRRIVRDARRARRAGAKVVIVNLHWGTEYRHAPDAFQTGLARRLARHGAITAVVGQHAHVVQPIRRVDGLPVVFGEGNLLSNQTAACCPAASQDGMLVRLHIRVGRRRARVTRIGYLPTWVRHPDYAVVPAPPDSRRRTIDIVGRSKRLRPLLAARGGSRSAAP